MRREINTPIQIPKIPPIVPVKMLQPPSKLVSPHRKGIYPAAMLKSVALINKIVLFIYISILYALGRPGMREIVLSLYF